MIFKNCECCVLDLFLFLWNAKKVSLAKCGFDLGRERDAPYKLKFVFPFEELSNRSYGAS